MKASRRIDVAFQSILKNKMRTLLTMLGIIMGVGAVMVMVAVGQGAQSQIRERINNLGTNLIVITPGSASQGGVSMGGGSMNRLTLADAEMLERESVLLKAVSPVIVSMAQAVSGEGNWRAFVNGVSPDYATIRDWDVESGRFFDETDVRALRKVVLLGRTVAPSGMWTTSRCATRRNSRMQPRARLK